MDIYRNKNNIADYISTIVDLKDIVNGNLSPSKYVVKTEFESSDYGKVKIYLDKLIATKTLSDVGNFYRGINVTSKNVQDPNGSYKIINLADIKNGELDVDSLLSYTIENNARVESYKVEDGDIIISNKGATKICIIPEHEGNILISQNFIGIRLKSKYNPQYIKEFLESPIGEYLIESRKTGTAVAMINPKDLKEIPILDMDLEKQNEIINDYREEEKELKDEFARIMVVLKSGLLDENQYRNAFEYMLESVSELSGKSGGEGTTPNFINRLAVEIVEPKNGEFYDGAFGMGGGAIEAYNYASQYGNELKIYGQELNLKTYSIACIRMFINGIKSADVRIGDVLVNPIFKENENTLKKFDSIIMDPPFSLQWKDKENEILNDKYARFIYGTPGVASADWLFIFTALKSLKENGKAVIITTLGSLFRAGAEETLRNKIIGFDYIECIIELAGGLFTGTGIPCAMIVFNMNKSEKMKDKIQFINADDIYENIRRGKNILNEDNINIILDIYRNKKVVEDISTIVDLKEIVNGNLSPSKYVVKTKFESSDYGKVKIYLDKLIATKTLGDVGSFYRGINVTSKNVQDPNGSYKIINLADIKNGELDVDSIPSYSIENNARIEAYRVEAGDIIISNKGTTKICIIPEHDGNILISQNFIGIRLKSKYNPQYIKEFLESPIGEYLIESRKKGTAVAMINPKDLKEIPLVDMDLDKQNEIINQYNEAEINLKRKLEELQNELDNLKFDLYNKMNIKDIFDIIN